MMKKSRKSESGGVKIEENREGGASKRQQNSKLEKIGVVLNCVAPFYSIFVENGSQDGGQNPIKIDKKNYSEFCVFFDRFFDAFWEGFGSQNGRKIDAKTMSKTCWDRS